MSNDQRPPPAALRRLQDLVVYPREDLDRELKEWLDIKNDDAHRADVAQALIALANHGGGFLVFGFDDAGKVAAGRPADFSGYTQDAINGILQGYAEPPFHCEVHQVPHLHAPESFPVVVVPGPHRVPIRTKRDGPRTQGGKGPPQHVKINTYPIRRLGPKSEPPQSGQEWDDLIGRCVRTQREQLIEDLRRLLVSPGTSSLTPLLTPPPADTSFDQFGKESLQRWKTLVANELASEKPSRYEHGYWTCAYQILGTFPKITAAQLLEKLRTVEGHETGWPVWIVLDEEPLKPKPYDGLVECWFKVTTFNDAAHSDFWRASPTGLLFLLRGYQEDSPDPTNARTFTPGVYFDPILPIWRVGECLLHASRLSQELGVPSAQIRFRFTWTGLKGRILTFWVSPISRSPLRPRKASQDSVTSDLVVQADLISTSLPQLVGEITRPLFESFEFFEVKPQLIQEELARMQVRST